MFNKQSDIMDYYKEEVFPAALSLFEPIPINVGYQKIQYVDYHTSSHLNNGSCLNFTIPATSSQYIDLKRSRLCVKAYIMKEDGTKPNNSDIIAPVNLVLHSLFTQADVQIQQQVLGGGQLYGYKAYIETLRQPPARHSFSQSQVYYRDTASLFNSLEVPPNGNNGHIHRFGLFVGGSTVDLEGPLMSDFFQQERLLINGVEMKVTLTQARDAFCIMAPSDGWKIQLVEAYIKICKVTPLPFVILAHDAALKLKPATYPFNRTEMKAYQLNAGHFEFNFEDIFQGSVPSQVVCAIVDSNAYNGAYDKNPYLFHHYDINYLSLCVDDESVPGKPLKMNFSDENFIEAYQTLFAESFDQGSIDITRVEYKGGYALFTFRIAPDNHSHYLSPQGEGNVKLSGVFDKALPHNATLILLATFPSILQIDSSRNVRV